MKKYKLLHNLTKILLLFLITFVIQYSLSMPFFEYDFELFYEQFLEVPYLFFLSTSILLFVFGLLYLVVQKFYSSLSIFISFFIIVAMVNAKKVELLFDPLYPSDFKMARNIGEFSDILGSKLLVLIITAIALLIGANVIIYIKDKRNIKLPNTKWHRFAIIALVFIIVINFNRIFNLKNPSHGFYKIAVSAGYETNKWNQNQAYGTNGPILGFIYNFKSDIMIKPANYSKKTMTEINETYTVEAAKINAERNRENFEGISVIYLLSESFSNPENIGIEFETSPLQYITDPSDKLVHSKFISPIYGGGTAAVEFEILTGFAPSLFQPGSKQPYQDFVSSFSHLPSFISRAYPNDSISIHSYNSKFYKRPSVYKTFGFKDSYFESDMEGYTETLNNHFILDSELYTYLLNMMYEDQNSSFYHVITMQNHASYPNGFESLDYIITDSLGLSDETKEIVEVYTQGLAITDNATASFVESLMSMDEDVLLVFYGDHAPNIYGEFRSNPDFPNKERLFDTDFFIVSNFSDTKIEKNYVTPMNLESLVYKTSDVKVSPYIALQTLIEENLLITGDGKYRLQTGEYVTLEELSGDLRTLVNDYELVMYDVLSKSNNLPYSFWE